MYEVNDFNLGQKVRFVLARDIEAIVVATTSDGMYNVTWFHNGERHGASVYAIELEAK